jgi:hypothetical protein
VLAGRHDEVLAPGGGEELFEALVVVGYLVGLGETAACLRRRHSGDRPARDPTPRRQLKPGRVPGRYQVVRLLAVHGLGVEAGVASS